MRTPRHLTAFALVALLSACGPDGTPPDAARDPTPPPSPTTSPAPSPTEETSECRAAEPDSHETSATCLYEAFRNDDRELAARFATPEAVRSVFELGGHDTDDQWAFEECGRPRETQPTSGVSCHYLIPGEVHGVQVEMAMRADHVVESVQAIG